MTMLAITKFLTWNGNTCTTVHLQLPLHLTDVLLFSVSRPGAAVGKGKKNNYWPSCHCNILSSTTLKQRRPSQRTPWFVCCLGMYESHFQRCNGPLEKNPMCSTVVSISKSYCYASHWIVKYLLWQKTENIWDGHQYLLDREKDLEGLWFLSRERDLSLLLSLEKDLKKAKPSH